MAIRTTLYSDPACPWAYSATPALSVLRWRYRDQLDWGLVTIGLGDTTDALAASGYSTARQATGSRRFRDRYGTPFAAAPRTRLVATGRACRAVVAARLRRWGRGVLRGRAGAWFNGSRLLDEDAAIAAALAEIDGIDAGALVAALDSAGVSEPYEAAKAQAGGAAGRPT